MQSGIVEVDIHGMNCYQAKVKLDSVLRRADASVYRVLVIHGFHSGEALKDMVRTEYAAHPKVLRVEKPVNQGQTTLVLREF